VTGRGDGAKGVRVAPPLLALAAAVAPVAISCAPRPPPGAVLGDAVRVCEAGRPCEIRPAASAAFRPEEANRRGERQQDPDAYRGEHLGVLRAAAQAGDPAASYRLGLVHQQGLAGAPRDPRSAIRHFESAAEAGHPWARFRLAQMLDASGADRARSLELKTAAAEAGVTEAAALLGTQYREGRGGVPRDPAEAARWFAVAAENGVPEAQYNLGLMHYRGEGVPRQLHEALRWMRQAAANGHVPAQRAVGQLYLTGLDTMGQDLQEARSWLASAASRGDRESQRLLAELDRAEAAERDHARRYRMLWSVTAAYWASAAYAAYRWHPHGYYGYYDLY
jgi:TPR repeat protein